MLEWLVLADDRTGALEVAGSLAVAVGPVPVAVAVAVHGGVAASSASPVLVVDLASRHLPASEAAARAAAWSLLTARRLHKIDSTLRGRWADELVAVRQATGSRVLVVPALPRLGRTCRGGVVHVDGRPLTLDDPRHGPVEARPSVALTSTGAEAVASLGGAADVASWLLDAHGPGFAVCDATTDADLTAIAAAWAAADGVVLAGTSAALAAAVVVSPSASPDVGAVPASSFDGGVSQPDDEDARHGTTGHDAESSSRRRFSSGVGREHSGRGLTGSVGFRDNDGVLSRRDGRDDGRGATGPGVGGGTVSSSAGFSSGVGREHSGRGLTGSVGFRDNDGVLSRRDGRDDGWGATGLGGPVLVVVGSLHPVARAQVAALDVAGLDVEVLTTAQVDGPIADADAARVADGLAVAARRRLAGGDVATLVIVGGDTAAAVLGDGVLVAGGTVAPGIPWSRRADGSGPLVVTKAGGFGDPQTLVELLNGGEER